LKLVTQNISQKGSSHLLYRRMKGEGETLREKERENGSKRGREKERKSYKNTWNITVHGSSDPKNKCIALKGFMVYF
jgi:hypothetical protein